MQTYNYSEKSMVKILSKGSFLKKRKLSSILFLLTALTVTSILISVVSTLVGIFSVDERISIHIITLILSIVLFIAFFWKENCGDFFSFINIILIWYFLIFVIPILLLLYLPETHTKPGYWDISFVEYSIWIIIISLYSLVFGYKIIGRNRGGIVIQLSLIPSENRIVSASVICVASYVIFLLMKSYMMETDIWNLIRYQPYGSEFSKREYGMGIYTFINLLGMGLEYLFSLYFILPRNKPKRQLVMFATLIILFGITNTIAYAVIRTSKATVFFLIFFIFCFMHYTKRRIRFREIVMIFLIGIVTLSMFNYRRIPEEFQHELKGINTPMKMYTHTFEDFEMLCVITSFFPDVKPYYYGKRLFEEITYLPIPRAIWKEKNIAYGCRGILYDINPGFFAAGYHTGLQSQFYADFGLLGVVIGFIMFGGIIRLVYNIFKLNFYNKGIIILYILIIYDSWLFLKGGFPWLNLIVVGYIPFYILLRYVYPMKMNTRIV